MVGEGGFAHLATQTHSYPYITSLHPSHPSLLAPIPYLRPIGGSSNASHLVVIEWRRDKGKHVDLLRLAEFQTPIIFDFNCNFNCSTTNRHPKIVAIIIDTFYINRNASVILS